MASQYPSLKFPPNQKLHSLWDGANWLTTPAIPEAAATLRTATNHLSLDMLSKDRLLWHSFQVHDLSLSRKLGKLSEPAEIQLNG